MSRFPILWPYPRKDVEELTDANCPRSVPWELVAPHEKQANRNHGQTLQCLAQRGGLSPHELVAMLSGKRWSDVSITAMSNAEVVAEITKRVAELKK